MRMIARRQRADALELARADLDHGDAAVVVEMGNNPVSHGCSKSWWSAAHHSGTVRVFLALRHQKTSNWTQAELPRRGRVAEFMVMHQLEADPRIIHERRVRPKTGRRMNPLRVAIAFIVAGLFAIAALVACPIAMEADILLKSEDDPAMLADRALANEVRPGIRRPRDRSGAGSERRRSCQQLSRIGARAQCDDAQPRSTPR